MKKFEYMTKRVSFFSKNAYEDGEFSALECIIPPTMAAVGQQGWELVQVLHNPTEKETSVGLYAIFKREIV
jgi:hypothetical protein